jgi:hypothetical protein
VVPQIVPYPAPLDAPPISRSFLARRFRTVAADSSIETQVHIYVCRDRHAALSAALGPRSLVVIGGKRRWWPTREQRLAAELAKQGHHVVFANWE